MKLEKLEELLAERPDYRLQQARKALFQRGIKSWQEATALPQELREELADKLPVELKAETVKSATDDTIKAALELEDGLLIETVLMRSGKRNTVCVSTQVGCPFNCRFCATGRLDYRRDLRAEEMLEQVLFFRQQLSADERIDNIVLMGMGEPFANYEETTRALCLLNSEDYFNIGARRLSVSTAGIPGRIRDFADFSLQVNLALSLHAAVPETRSQLMPINNRYPLREVISALDDYVATTNRKVMYEYIPLAGINDSPTDIKALVDLLSNRLHFLNLIPYNPTGELEGISSSRLHELNSELERAGLNVGIRRSYGSDIKAACGQLARRGAD